MTQIKPGKIWPIAIQVGDIETLAPACTKRRNEPNNTSMRVSLSLGSVGCRRRRRRHFWRHLIVGYVIVIVRWRLFVTSMRHVVDGFNRWRRLSIRVLRSQRRSSAASAPALPVQSITSCRRKWLTRRQIAVHREATSPTRYRRCVLCPPDSRVSPRRAGRIWRRPRPEDFDDGGRRGGGGAV